MAPFYYDPPAGSSGMTQLIMQVTMIGIVAGSFFQPAQSIARTVITLLTVGVVFDLAQRVIDFLTRVLTSRLKTTFTYEEGTVEYQWFMTFLRQKNKLPEVNERNYSAETPAANFWSNGSWVTAMRYSQKDNYYSSFSQNNDCPKAYIELTLYSLKPAAKSNLLKEAKQQYSEARNHTTTVFSRSLQNVPGMYNNNTQTWADKREIPSRLMDSTALSFQAMASLVEEARNFFDSETWYNEAGIPWQKRYLLYGPSGSGKRDAIYTVAGRLARSVYTIVLSPSNSVDDASILSAMSTIPKGSIFLLENIDLAFQPPYVNPNDLSYQPCSPIMQPTSFGLFKMLDTAACHEGILLFATTTMIDSIDTAIFQPGRIDKKIKFSHVTQEQTNRVFSRFFPSSSAPQPSLADKKTLPLSDLAHEFSSCIPENKFTISQIRYYLLKHQSSAESAVANVKDWVKDEQEQMRKRVEEGMIAEQLRLEAQKVQAAAMLPLNYTGCVCGGRSCAPPHIPSRRPYIVPMSPAMSPQINRKQEMSEVASEGGFEAESEASDED